MKFKVCSIIYFFCICVNAQKITFEEYDLEIGLHVILHQDNSIPLVNTSVLYKVGSKDGPSDRTGFAHFFEHLLFEGSKNIPLGQWDNILNSNGGMGNAETTDDYTYYYEKFPSNNLELSLWMESERMLHPIITQKEVQTQREVVKEEKRLKVENSPYMMWQENINKNIYKKHPYKRPPFGEMDHLDAASLDEFLDFNKKFYVPNNAILVVAGDFETKKTKKMISEYFGDIPRGEKIERSYPIEEKIESTRNALAYDSNIQIPALFIAYLNPSMKSRENRIIEMISAYLFSGKSSKIYKRLVDDKKIALQATALNLSQEDYSTYVMISLPLGDNDLDSIVEEIDQEIKKIQDDLISDRDYNKLQNKFELNYINSNSNLDNIARSLAVYFAIHGDTNLINAEIEIYRSITKEEIRSVAKNLLDKNKRVILKYLPKK